MADCFVCVPILDRFRGRVTDCHMVSAKEAAIAILRRGEATPPEIAELAGVSRMTAYRWAAEAGDWQAAIDRRLARAWAQALEPSKRRRTRAALRDIADDATAAFWAKGGEVTKLPPGR